MLGFDSVFLARNDAALVDLVRWPEHTPEALVQIRSPTFRDASGAVRLQGPFVETDLDLDTSPDYCDVDTGHYLLRRRCPHQGSSSAATSGSWRLSPAPPSGVTSGSSARTVRGNLQARRSSQTPTPSRGGARCGWSTPASGDVLGNRGSRRPGVDRGVSAQASVTRVTRRR